MSENMANPSKQPFETKALTKNSLELLLDFKTYNKKLIVHSIAISMITHENGSRIMIKSKYTC